MAWFELGEADSLPVGALRGFMADGLAVTVYHLEDGFYATADACTHEDCSLSADGEIQDQEVICTCHGGAFHIKTGKATKMPCISPVETFPVQVNHHGKIEIQID
nr:Rieske 2Fe-2S domain-containing protein [Bacilli bacterium]